MSSRSRFASSEVTIACCDLASAFAALAASIYGNHIAIIKIAPHATEAMISAMVPCFSLTVTFWTGLIFPLELAESILESCNGPIEFGSGYEVPSFNSVELLSHPGKLCLDGDEIVVAAASVCPLRDSDLYEPNDKADHQACNDRMSCLAVSRIRHWFRLDIR